MEKFERLNALRGRCIVKRLRHRVKPSGCGYAFKPCQSPKSYKVKPGKHVFTVEAVDAAGADATPAIYRFKVVRRR